MRDIADHAGVAISTVYRYFPSKIHLLVTALNRELSELGDTLADDLTYLDGPFERLGVAATSLTNAMEHSGRISGTLTQAYIAATVTAPREAEAIQLQTTMFFSRGMGAPPRCGFYRHIAALITDVWTGEVLALVQKRRTFDDLRCRLQSAIDLVASTAALDVSQRVHSDVRTCS